MSESKPVQARFRVELRDMLQAERAHYRQSKFVFADRAFAIAAFLYGLFVVASIGFYSWGLLMFPLSVLLWIDFFSLRQLRVRFMYARNPKHRQECTMTFSEEDIRVQSETIDSIVRWSYFERVIEAEEVFLLYYGKGMYTLLPKRGLQSTYDLGQFRGLLTRRLGSAASVGVAGPTAA